MKPEGALIFNPIPDLCELSLRDAIQALCVPKIYTLLVAPAGFLTAKEMLMKIGAYAADNPLSPQINLLVDEGYTDEYEWSLEVDGKIIWSPGA